MTQSIGAWRITKKSSISELMQQRRERPVLLEGRVTSSYDRGKMVGCLLSENSGGNGDYKLHCYVSYRTLNKQMKGTDLIDALERAKNLGEIVLIGGRYIPGPKALPMEYLRTPTFEKVIEP